MQKLALKIKRQKCKIYMKLKKLPLKLRMFNSDLLLLNDYLLNPDLPIFEYV